MSRYLISLPGAAAVSAMNGAAFAAGMPARNIVGAGLNYMFC